MTDRSTTENKVNEIICADNDILVVNSFKCSVHPLLQFGTVAQKKVGEIEKNYKINQDLNLGDSITENLLRFVSKLFYKYGAGDPLYAPTYLREQGINNVPIMNYRGNRFSTIFHNAARTFYIAKHLINYFTNSKSTLNYTHNFILTALNNDYVISICRALGIISKTVTEPYWRCAGDSDRNALNMGSIYEQLIDLLTNGANSPNLLITNRLLVIGPQLEPDKVSQSLFEKSSLDDMTQSVLQQLCTVIKDKSKQLFKDFLVKENKKYLYDQRVINIKERERLKKEREEKKKKIKEKIEKDLEDIGIWNNIETIEK